MEEDSRVVMPGEPVGCPDNSKDLNCSQNFVSYIKECNELADPTFQAKKVCILQKVCDICMYLSKI